ncbi:hypothetical protein [Tahibacter caeni]|uniref:hypothetical protein n=1 Tax=Tahibacter caeni TaxID=1453545 RepID=UPI00214888FC|nr:hypothetical protein [Tahibacter caeni]
MKICLRLPGRPPFLPGRLICFHIPCWPWDRWRDDPFPPFEIDGKAPDWLPDARALASLNALIPTVGRDAARHLNAASKGLLESLKARLPEGATVTFMKDKPKVRRTR